MKTAETARRKPCAAKPVRALLWCLPLLALLCVAWADSWQTLQSAAGTITSVQADFTQEKHLPILARPLVSEGRFYYQAPKSLRWEYTRPVRSILLMHAGRVQRFVAGASGMTEEHGPGLDAMQVVLEEITHWLAGRFNENPMFDTRLDSEQHLIVLTPRQPAMQQVIQQITVHLADQPGVIQSVEIRESKDAYTRMIFNHTVLNQPIDDAVFRKVS